MYQPPQRQFLVRQWRDGLLVTLDASVESDKTKTRKFDVDHIFRRGRLILVTISSGPEGTAVYLDGQPAQIFPGFKISAFGCFLRGWQVFVNRHHVVGVPARPADSRFFCCWSRFAAIFCNCGGHGGQHWPQSRLFSKVYALSTGTPTATPVEWQSVFSLSSPRLAGRLKAGSSCRTNQNKTLYGCGLEAPDSPSPFGSPDSARPDRSARRLAQGDL